MHSVGAMLSVISWWDLHVHKLRRQTQSCVLGARLGMESPRESSSTSTSPEWGAPRPEPQLSQYRLHRTHRRRKQWPSLLVLWLRRGSSGKNVNLIISRVPNFSMETKPSALSAQWRSVGSKWSNANGKPWKSTHCYKIRGDTTVRILRPWEYGKAGSGNFKFYMCKFFGKWTLFAY